MAQPILEGTRLTVEDSILGNLDAGVDENELPELFPVLKDKKHELQEIIAFAKARMHVPHFV